MYVKSLNYYLFVFVLHRKYTKIHRKSSLLFSNLSKFIWLHIIYINIYILYAFHRPVQFYLPKSRVYINCNPVKNVEYITILIR